MYHGKAWSSWRSCFKKTLLFEVHINLKIKHDKMSAEAKTICYQYKLFLTQNIIFSKDKIVIKILFVLLQVSRKHGSDIAWRMRIPNMDRNRNHRPNSPRHGSSASSSRSSSSSSSSSSPCQPVAALLPSVTKMLERQSLASSLSRGLA